MKNPIQLDKVTKEQLKEKICQIIDQMTNHDFKKFKKIINRTGALDDIC